MNKEINNIIENSKEIGWILEPDAKKILSYYNIKTPAHIFSDKYEEIETFVKDYGFPVVLKVVSPDIVHKSDVGGVIVGIETFKELKSGFKTLMQLKNARGVIVESMVTGIELIIGSKNELQFGPVILAGYGGIGVEIYKDTSIRMAPVENPDIESMLKQLKCYPLLNGFRGKPGIAMEQLIDLIKNFSKMVMDLKTYYSSIDLNPVICNENDCFVADARIMLK